MGIVFVDYLEQESPIYTCERCHCHLARSDQLISKAFKGRTGTAYLFNEAINFTSGPLENRLLMTGLHVIADIYCVRCNAMLGWRYEHAFDESQKYKEGKVILELATIRKLRT
mmetsp:Transcript_18055/g.57752  ORF Transcript_18055/g.57752 Transcript_18055/m.57752 type:complete len:113 (-) Transcript_18055:20-358(-)